MCIVYIVWYIGLEKYLYGLVLEYYRIWIVSLDII